MEHWFDSLSRAMAAEQSRRGLLRRFGAGILGAALGSKVFGSAVEAQA
jgi:hypothetical protein